MTQNDLFTASCPEEESYAAALMMHTQQIEEYFIDNGIVPPWVEADFLLDKSERRLLELVDEHAGYLMSDDDWHVTPYADDGARRVSGFTRDMGMLAEANSKAVLNAAISRGLVKVTRDNDAGGIRIDMQRRGRYYLDMTQDDEWWDLGD